MQDGAPALWISATGPISSPQDVEAFTRALHAEQTSPRLFETLSGSLRKVQFHIMLPLHLSSLSCPLGSDLNILHKTRSAKASA